MARRSQRSWPASNRSVGEVEHQLENGDAAYFLAEDQEFVDKALSASGRLPRVRKIIVFDTRALFQYSDDRLISFDAVLDRGRDVLAASACSGEVDAGSPPRTCASPEAAGFLARRAGAVKAGD